MKTQITESAVIVEWVRRAQGGDREAFGDLVSCFRQGLLNYCFWLSRRREQAEDLVQESLLRAMENLKSLREPAAFPDWIRTIAHHLFLSQEKRGALEGRRVEEPSVVGAEDTATPASRDLYRVLSQLPERNREVVTLVCLRGHSYKEAAAILNCSHHAVRCSLFRARKNCYRLLERERAIQR